MLNSSVFKIESVAQRYSEVLIDFPDIEIPRGGFIGVLGRSGSGKTTFLNFLSLLDRAPAGEIVFFPTDGGEVAYSRTHQSPTECARRRQLSFGFVFQNDELLDGLSVEDNIQLPFWPGGRQATESHLISLLKAVGLEAGVLKRNPLDLSAGQRSRIGLLRALSGEPQPEVVFADEPTANVDAGLESDIYELLEGWRTDGEAGKRTVLLSTHRLDIASRYCTGYVVVEKKGKKGDAEHFVGRFIDSRQTEEQLRLLLDLPKLESANCEAEWQNGEAEKPHGRKIVIPPTTRTVAHSPIRAIWKFLYRDFWRHRPTDSSLLGTYLAPLLVLLALFLFICVGGFIIGIREGSSALYAADMNSDLLWNTQLDGEESEVVALENRLSGGQVMFRSRSGFDRWPILARPASRDQDSANVGLRTLLGRTMEASDGLLPLLIGRLTVPPSAQAQERVLNDFRAGRVGIIISQDALGGTLGYQVNEKSPPSEVFVQLDTQEQNRTWLPLLGIAKEIPGADFVISPGVRDCYRDDDCLKGLRAIDTFWLLPKDEIREEAPTIKSVTSWLTAMGVGVGDVQVATFGIEGEQKIQVRLSAPAPARDFVPLVRQDLSKVGNVRDVQFFADLHNKNASRSYRHWSVILERSLDSVRAMIQATYANSDESRLLVDTSVQARVQALESGYAVFRVLSFLLLATTMLFGSILLFSIAWFESVRKTHSVGVMLSLGVDRTSLLKAYALQQYFLIGALLAFYIFMDALGLPDLVAAFLNNAMFSVEATGIRYMRWSLSWFIYIGILLVLIPGLIRLLRGHLYNRQPAILLKS